MIILILLMALSAAATAEWNLTREISPASEDSLCVWTLDTGAGPLWSLPAGGEIHWSCFQAGADDSLLLPWQSIAEDCTLDVAVSVEGPAGRVRCQIGCVVENGDIQPVTLRDAGSSSPDSEEEGWIVSPAEVQVQESVSQRLMGVCVRTATATGLASPASIRITRLRVHAGGRTASLAPTPRPVSVAAGSALRSAWQLPSVTGAQWRLETSTIGMPESSVAWVWWPLAAGERADERRLLWSVSRLAEGWRMADLRHGTGYADTLVGLLEPPADGGDTLQLTLALEVREGGLVDGVVVRGRPRAPRAGELSIVQVMCAPAEDEFVQIANRLPWSLSLPALRIEVNGEDCTCGEINIPAHGSVAIMRPECPGLVVPNDEARIRLLCNGWEMDEISFGPGHPAPAPPYGWALRRDSVYTMERAPMPDLTGAAFPVDHTLDGGSVALTELLLWPLDGPDRFVEIAHMAGDAVELEGWALLCEGAFVFPEETKLGPEGVIVVAADGFPSSFALNPAAGEVTLIDRWGRIVDRVHWGSPPPPGHSLSRIVSHAEKGGAWLPAFPTPGANLALPRLCTVEVTTTGDGRVVQWECAYAADVVFSVYRALVSQPDARIQVSTLPIGGAPPYSFVDIDVDPEQTYLYWIAAMGPTGEEASVGPVLSAPNATPLRMAIGPATPNPFRSVTTVPYSIYGVTSEEGRIVQEFEAGHRMRVGVYTVGGGLLKVFETDCLQDGSFRVVWDGCDDTGRLCPPGVYVVSLQVGPYVRSARVVFAGP